MKGIVIFFAVGLLLSATGTVAQIWSGSASASTIQTGYASAEE